jgi:hypothetical protein
MIMKCGCIHKGQDGIHGNGRRVHNETAKGYQRCTVCLTEKGATRSSSNFKKKVI